MIIPLLIQPPFGCLPQCFDWAAAPLNMPAAAQKLPGSQSCFTQEGLCTECICLFSNYHSIEEALGNYRQCRLKPISARWHKHRGGSEGIRVQTPAGVGGAGAAGPHLRPRPPQRAGQRPHLMVQAKR